MNVAWHTKEETGVRGVSMTQAFEAFRWCQRSRRAGVKDEGWQTGHEVAKGGSRAAMLEATWGSYLSLSHILFIRRRGTSSMPAEHLRRLVLKGFATSAERVMSRMCGGMQCRVTEC
jgi:hypothetical protein